MFRENVPLSKFSSYKIGGPARYFFEAKTANELKEAVEEAKKRNLEFLVLGGGTNFLIGDEGFSGLVLKPSIDFLEIFGEEISVGAGTSMHALVSFSAEHSLSGLEWAGGLPGTVGGAIRGNAGAFGGEIKDSVEKGRSLDISKLEEIERNVSGCEFGYRQSVFSARGARQQDGQGSALGGKNSRSYNKEIIISAVFGLAKGDSEKIKNSINEKISYRREHHPMEHPNAGSIFKNVDVRKITESQIARFKKSIKTDPFPVVPAAYIISEAGLKGLSCGGAMVSPKHPNFIVNVSNARSSDVKNLINLVKTEVKNKFGIDLEEEIISA